MFASISSIIEPNAQTETIKQIDDVVKNISKAVSKPKNNKEPTDKATNKVQEIASKNFSASVNSL